MDIQQLRGFFEVAREKSFTKAAGRLFLTQPAISQQVKALEDELGDQLIERRRGGVVLTPAGEILYRRTRRVLDDLRGAREELDALRHVMTGTVTVATSDTNCMYILPVVLERFRREFPEVVVVVLNKLSSEVGQLVAEDEVDFGLATLPMGRGVLQTESLFTRRDVLICPPEHRWAKRRQIAMPAVADEPLLVLEQGSMSRTLLDEAFRQSEQSMSVAMNLGSIEVIKRFVQIGFGVAVVPEIAVQEEVGDGSLAAARINGMRPRDIGIVAHRTRNISAAAGALLDIVRTELKGKRL